MFTITFFLLGTVLLALAFLIFNISQSTERRATEFAINNRVNDLSTSVSKSLSDTFIAQSGINISIVNTTLSIQELVPNPRLTNYSNTVNNFKSFVESREPYVYINNANINSTRLIITPINSTFYNELTGDDIEKRYITNFVNVNNITFSIYRSDIPVVAIFWEEYTAGPTSVTAIFRNDTTTITRTRNADLTKKFRVTFYPGPTFDDDIDFEVRDGNLLKVFDLRYNTTLNMTMTFDSQQNLRMYMDNPVNVNASQFNITKITRPRIL